MRDIIDRLVALVANWPRPGVRLFAPLVGVLGQAIKDAGIPVAPHRVRQVMIGGAYIGKIAHGERTPRQQFAIVIKERTSGRIVFEARPKDITSKRVRDFCRNPRRVLTAADRL